MFRQMVPSIELSIEEGTTAVPADGLYYVVLKGEAVFSSASQARALNKYRRLKVELLKDK